MEKTNELKQALLGIYKARNLWNQKIKIDGESYIYISSRNEFRRVVRQPSGEQLVIVGCMIFGNFMWCC